MCLYGSAHSLNPDSKHAAYAGSLRMPPRCARIAA